METIGKRIAHARERAGLSQQALAVRLGRDKSTVWRWESGQSEPSLANLRELGSLLDADPKWLAYGGRFARCAADGVGTEPM